MATIDSTKVYFIPNFFTEHPYALTIYSILPNIIKEDYLMWYRIGYTVLLTILSRWVFVKSNFSSLTWIIHNTGLVSALIGMWLLTINHLIPYT